MIVLGLGSGRTGTASLSQLIGGQHGAICFHELNPTGVVFEGNPQPVLNTLREFQAMLDGGDTRLLALDYTRPASVRKYQELQGMAELRLMGDIAYYYLNYVEDILAINDRVRFVCIKRDRRKTVESWLRKSAIDRWPSLWLSDRLKAMLTRTPFYRSRNFWQRHDGSFWQPDPVWDKTFPKFEAASKREAIEKYWDYYYREAAALERKHPAVFRIFHIDKLSSREGQAEILRFIGVPEADMVLQETFHAHRSRGMGLAHGVQGAGA